MTKKIITAVIVMLATLFLIGAASAASVDITSTAPIDPITGAYIIPINGMSAYASVNLQAEYMGWILPATYDIQVRAGNEDPTGTIVWSVPITAMPFSTFTAPIAWIPTTSGLYTVYAEGNKIGKIRSAVQVTNPIPESSTSILTATGLIGLFGLVRSRRRD